MFRTTAMLVACALPLAAQPTPPRAPRAHSASVGVRPGNSYLGVGVVEIDADRARNLKLKDEHGVYVARVDENSPASKAGLKEGDVVLEYNGQRVEGTAQFGRMIAETPVGRKASLLVNRNGANQTISAALEARSGGNTFFFSNGDVELPVPPMPPLAVFPPEPQFPSGFPMQSSSIGIEAESLNSQLAEYFGVKDGVLVRSVFHRSAAEQAGMKAGDVVVKVDGASVKTAREITSIVRANRSKKHLAFTLVRNHKEMTVTVNFDDIARHALPPVLGVADSILQE